MLYYQCCICKETVNKESASSLDPCSLILASNIDQPRDDQKEQEFFCHLECFRRLVNNDGIMYIIESDAATIGENKADESNWSEDATAPNKRLERTRHERASLLSCVGEPLKRNVIRPERALADSS